MITATDSINKKTLNVDKMSDNSNNKRSKCRLTQAKKFNNNKRKKKKLRNKIPEINKKINK